MISSNDASRNASATERARITHRNDRAGTFAAETCQRAFETPAGQKLRVTVNWDGLKVDGRCWDQHDEPAPAT
jgi:hypothetical protein